MGSSDSKPKILNQKLNIRFERTNIDELDNIYEDAFKIVKDSEILRCDFLLKWNEYVRQTGGTVIIKPKFEDCLLGMLWKLAVDMNGELSSVDIIEKDPFIVFSDKLLLKNEDMTNTFTNLCKFCVMNKEKVNKLDVESQKFDRETNSFLKDTESLLTDKYNIAPREFYAMERKLITNAKRIRLSHQVITEIREIFEDVNRGLQRYSLIMKQPEQLNQIEMVGIEAIKKKIDKPARIVYKFSKEDKLSNFEDNADVISDDLKAEKEARSVLDEITPRNLVKKVFSGLSRSGFFNKKETEIYPTVQTTSTVRKDTATDTKPSEPIEFIVSDRDMKPKDLIVKDIDYKLQTVTPYDTTKQYSQVFSKSQIIENPSATEEKISRKYPTEITENKQEQLMFMKTYQPESSGYEKLKQEIEGLRKENENLLLKVSTLSMEKFPEYEKSKLVSESTLQKIPVFIRHHVPIVNWNIVLKKTVDCPEALQIISIEPAIDLEYIITGLANGKLIIWKFLNFKTFHEHKVISLGETAIRCLLYLNDSKSLICGCQDGKIIKCDLSLFSISTVVELYSPVVALNSPLNGYSLFAAAGHQIHEIDIENNNILNQIDAHDSPLTDLVYCQQKEILCSSSEDKSVKVWNEKNRQCLGTLLGHTAKINSICFANNKERHLILISVSHDSYITFWNLTDKNFTKSMKMNSPAEKVIYLWDKTTVLTIHEKGIFNLWNLNTDEPKELGSHEMNYTTLCYNDDGRNIIIATDVGKLELWKSK